jgi:hypothetical protein
MIKKRLVDFINKYNIAKNEQVIIDSTNNTLKVESKPMEVGGLRISVELKDSTTPEGSFGIIETKKFKSMLSVLGDDINITFNKGDEEDNIVSIKFQDKTKKDVNVVAADLSVLERITPVISLPEEYPVVLPITDELIKDFNTSVNALGVSLFSISNFNNLEDVELLFGYREQMNTDVIKLPLKTILSNSPFITECSGKFNNNIYFNAEVFLEILNVNKDIMSFGKIMFSEDLVRIEYDSSDFKCQYLIVATEV